jgi:hypothetical protein
MKNIPQFGYSTPANPFGYERRGALGPEVARRSDVGPAREFRADVPSPTEAMAQSIHQEHVRRQNYAALMCGGNLPITGIGNTYPGADLDGTAIQFKQIFKNTLGRILAVKVSVDFGPSTGSVDFSFSTDLSGQSVIDSATASGRSVTDNILLAPDQILYAATRDPLVSLAGAAIRVLLLDPVSVFGEGILP